MKEIPGGSFLLARKIFQSEVWLKQPFYLRVWLWILGHASHSDHEENGYRYKRGELITTYNEIVKAVAYYFNRQYIAPTLKKIRMILDWLEREGTIIVEPIEKTMQNNKNVGISFRTRADPTAHTGAFLGIRIIVVNYDAYQTLHNYKGRHKGRPSAELGHDNKYEEIKEYIYVQFAQFWKAYPRKMNKRKSLEIWERLKPDDGLFKQIMAALEKQKGSKQWLKDGGQYIPHPTTWLRGRRWEDEEPPPKPQPTPPYYEPIRY